MRGNEVPDDVRAGGRWIRKTTQHDKPAGAAAVDASDLSAGAAATADPLAAEDIDATGDGDVAGDIDAADDIVAAFFDYADREIFDRGRVSYELNGVIKNKKQGTVVAIGSMYMDGRHEESDMRPFTLFIARK